MLYGIITGPFFIWNISIRLQFWSIPSSRLYLLYVFYFLFLIKYLLLTIVVAHYVVQWDNFIQFCISSRFA